LSEANTNGFEDRMKSVWPAAKTNTMCRRDSWLGSSSSYPYLFFFFLPLL